MAIAISEYLELIPGDTVLAPATVVSTSRPGETVSLQFSGGGYAAATRQGVTALSFSIAAGDEVRSIEARPYDSPPVRPYAIVVAVAGEQAWVRWSNTNDDVVPLARLQRTRTAQQIEAGDPRPTDWPATAGSKRAAE